MTDIPGNASTTSRIVPGAELSGLFETEGDKDWYRISMEAGATYTFTLDVEDDGAPFTDPGYVTIYDAEGNSVDDPSGDGFAAKFGVVTADSTGDYYAEVWTGSGAGEGLSYTLKASTGQRDDHPGDATTEARLDLGVRQSVVSDYNGDADAFKVRLQAGTEYLLRVGGDVDVNRDVVASVLDPSGQVIGIDETWIGDAYVRFTAAETGDYLVGATTLEYNGGDDPQDIFIRVDETAGFDDQVGSGIYTDSAAGAQGIALGQKVDADLAYRGDSDWFSIDLAAGQSVAAVLDSSGPGMTVAGDIDVYREDDNGYMVRLTVDYEYFRGPEVARFTAEEADTYYFDVHHDLGALHNRKLNDLIGEYTFSVESGDFDPERNDTDTTATVTVGGSYAGMLDFAADIDWIGVDLVAGQQYQIESGIGFRNPAGNFSYTEWYRSDGKTVFTAVETGRHFLTKQGEAGAYTVGIEALPATADTRADTGTASTLAIGEMTFDRIETAGDADWHAVTLGAGTEYLFQLDVGSSRTATSATFTIRDTDGTALASGGHNSDVTFTTTPGKTVYVDVEGGDVEGYYGMIVAESTDDHSDEVTGATTVAAGSTVTGGIDHLRDLDVFSLSLEQDKTYVLTSTGPMVGINVANVDSGLYLDTYNSTNLQIVTAQEDGLHSISLGPFGRLGDYQLEISEGFTDAAVGSVRTTAAMTVGTAYVGEIDYGHDTDWVRVSLEAGKLYRVDVETTGGTGGLGDPDFALHDADGARLIGDTDNGIMYDARGEFFAEESGDYFIAVSGDGAEDTGEYRIEIEERETPRLIDALVTTYRMDDPANIAVRFDTGAGTLGWSAQERSTVQLVLDDIETRVDVGFSITDDLASTDWNLKTVASLGGNAAANFMYPRSGVQEGNFKQTMSGWDVDGFGAGTFAWSVLYHEFGHGLGLEHPHEADAGSTPIVGVNSPFDRGAYQLNQTAFTVMSYNNGFDYDGYAAGLSAIDLGALHEMYGANETHAAGDDVYEIPVSGANIGWRTIWDTGGTDTIRYGGTQSTTIDLRAATLMYEAGGGGFVSAEQLGNEGYTIANGVVIENAEGGSANDTLIGNAANNRFRGGEGSDRIEGGEGTDTAVFSGSSSEYSLVERLDGAVEIYLTNDLTSGGGSGVDTLISIERAYFEGDGVTRILGDDTGAPPIVEIADQTMALDEGQWRRLSDVITVTDPEGDPVIQYELWDSKGGDNWFADGGIVDASGGYVSGNLGGIWFRRDAVESQQTLWVRASDGGGFGEWESFTLDTVAPNEAPVVEIADQTMDLTGNRWQQLSDVMSVTDADGDTITKYKLWDSQGGDNWYADGRVVDASTGYETSSPDGIWFQRDASPSVQTLWVQAHDGEIWSEWEKFVLTTERDNEAPELDIANQSIGLDESPWVRLDSVLDATDADGDAIVRYELRDTTGGNNWFADGGIVDASAGYETANPGGVWFRRDNAPSEQVLEVRGYDGTDWGAWEAFTLTTAAIPNTAPEVAVADQVMSLTGDRWRSLSDVIEIVDADGDAATEFQVWDSTGMDNWYADGGIVDASAGYKTGNLDGIWFQRDTEASSQTLWVRASDGNDWSAWDRFELDTM